MPTFGFSAFLKLLSLNVRPQRTELKRRLRPTGDGFDFHRSLKLRIRRLLVDGELLGDVLASCSEITNTPERLSAMAGLSSLARWRDANPGELVEFQPKMFESPGGLFRVHFTPNFGIFRGGASAAIHVYNTKLPLDPRMVYAALSLFPELYAEDHARPDDLAVLSLRDLRLYSLSDISDHAPLGERVAASLDRLIGEIEDELGGPPPPSPPGPHPASP